MDQMPREGKYPDLGPRAGLIVLWVLLLLMSLSWAGNVADEATTAIGSRLSATKWAVPLALGAAVTVLTSLRVRRRFPQPVRRGLLALLVSVGFYGWIAAFGLSQGILVLVFVAITGLLSAWVLILPRRLAPPLAPEVLATLEDRDRIELADARLKLQNELRTTALQTIAGVAVLVGALIAFQQLTEDRRQATTNQDLTRQGQASERFTRAIDQLGSARPEVQLGGVYGLEQIAQQAPDNRLAVTEVLVAYLHRRSPRATKDATQPPQAMRLRAPEVQAVVTVLVRRTTGSFDPPLDLRGLDLRGAEFSGQRHLVGNRFGLKAGNLRRADLRGTDLRGAKVEGVYLSYADLRGADLRGADFAELDTALNMADDFSGRLDVNSRLKSAQLEGAQADASTKWPAGFDWHAAGVRMS